MVNLLTIVAKISCNYQAPKKPVNSFFCPEFPKFRY
uniref:Uncharacterized protein n=1 Tax=Rhizophora mucronata TaxID=61149 RepID=A0A2P2PTR4_RHIMU